MKEGEGRREINLGRDRLRVSSKLGNEFALALEGRGQVEEEERDLVKKVQTYVFDNPETHILGARLEEGDDLSVVTESLFDQVGLPPDGNESERKKFRVLRNRLYGHEDSTILVFPGASKLDEKVRKKLEKKVKKFGIKTFWG